MITMKSSIRFTLFATAFALVSFSSSAAPVSHRDALAYLSRYEGVRYVPYRDGASYWAVGIGHQLQGARKARYTPSEVHAFFTSDLHVARAACRRGITRFDGLPENAQLIAISVAFGVGPTGFQRFTRFRAALSQRRFKIAALELERSLWSAQVGRTRSHHAIRVLRELHWTQLHNSNP